MPHEDKTTYSAVGHYHASEAEDLIPLFPQPRSDVIELRQAIVIDVNASADTNTLDVGGGRIHDIPVLQTVTLTTLSPNDIVVIMRFRSMYFILGKIVSSS